MEQEQSHIHLKLTIFAHDERKQYQILTLIALKYRTNLSTLSTIFNIDEKTLYDNLMECNYTSDIHRQALGFLFYGDSFDQNLAAQKTLAFCVAWQKANQIQEQTTRSEEIKQLLKIDEAIIEKQKESKDKEEIKQNIEFRDQNDTNKEHGAMKKADDAIVVENNDRTIESVVNEVMQIIDEKIGDKL